LRTNACWHANFGWSQLPDGLLPWAALSQVSDRLTDATACGWITLCHWAMGREQATLSDPQWLHISADQSQTLMAAMLPFFESEGIELQHIEAGRWLARGQALNAPTASLERVHRTRCRALAASEPGIAPAAAFAKRDANAALHASGQ